MLAISLFFVSIVLVSNGIGMLKKIDGKSISFMNLIAGAIIIIGNFITLAQSTAASEPSYYNNIAGGLLFGFTYIFIAGNYLLKLDLRCFGLYCLAASAYAVIMSVMSFISGSWQFGTLWAAWCILWFAGTLQFNFKLKFMEKLFPYISIAEGLFAAFLPGILLLLGVWVI